jgi:hypothetical protein
VSLTAEGLSIDLPRGWDGRIRWVESDPAAALPAIHLGVPVAAGGTPNAVLHVANFGLPAQRGDYGSGAVEKMSTRNVFAALVEFDAEAGATALFASAGVPRVRGANFGPNAMQRVMPRMCGAQWFFTVGHRAFCLYAVLGSYALRRPLAAVLDPVIQTLRVVAR